MVRGPTILAVDSDPTARAAIGATLATLPADVHVAGSSTEFRDFVGTIAADLYLIDLDLPDGDGYRIARAICRGAAAPVVFSSRHGDEEHLAGDGGRRRSIADVVFSSRHGDEEHRLTALELGAIEYLAKPVSPRELALRVRNITTQLRRAKAGPGDPHPAATTEAASVIIGDLVLDRHRRCLRGGREAEVPLTASEFVTLALLAASPGSPVTRQAIAERLGPQSAARHNPRIVDILIWRLRKKLGRLSAVAGPIVTLPSQGYMLVAAAEAKTTAR
jgi:DNA-binding response OmpR family regulator